MRYLTRALWWRSECEHRTVGFHAHEYLTYSLEVSRLSLHLLAQGMDVPKAALEGLRFEDGETARRKIERTYNLPRLLDSPGARETDRNLLLLAQYSRELHF